jgi:hypothetical protein
VGEGGAGGGGGGGGGGAGAVAAAWVGVGGAVMAMGEKVTAATAAGEEATVPGGVAGVEAAEGLWAG